MGEAKRRALPTLRDWLAGMRSADADGRDAFADFVDWTVRMLERGPPDDQDHARLWRRIQAFSLAIVEIANQEIAAGIDPATTSSDICCSMGVAFGYALMSLDWRDDVPIRSFAIPMAEHFKTGLKAAIDECLAHAASEAAHV